MARKHYRAVKKQVEHSPVNGIFIPKKKKNQFYGIVSLFGILVFLHGLLVGFVIGKNK